MLRRLLFVWGMAFAGFAWGFPLSSIFSRSKPEYVQLLSHRLADWLSADLVEAQALLADSRFRRCLSELEKWDERRDLLSAVPKIWFRVGVRDNRVLLLEAGCEKTVFTWLQGKVQATSAAERNFLDLSLARSVDPDIVSRMEMAGPDASVEWIEARMSVNLYRLRPVLRAFVARYSQEFGLGIRLFAGGRSGEVDVVIP